MNLLHLATSRTGLVKMPVLTLDERAADCAGTKVTAVRRAQNTVERTNLNPLLTKSEAMQQGLTIKNCTVEVQAWIQTNQQ
jgi:hypothetical protein